MHRAILGLGFGDKRQTAHRNHNGLDDRRANLRICTYTQNAQNQLPAKNLSSKYKGVSRFRRDKKWQVSIKNNGKLIFLGHFNNEVEAAKAYDKAAKRIFGEFAFCNFR